MRSGYETVAAGAGEGQGAPLLLALHGTGGDAAEMARLGAALAPHARVLAPMGDVSEGGARRFFRRRAEGVYDMADLARAVEKMAGFLRAEGQGAPLRAALGYANGANLLAALAMAHPGLLDTLVLMHPLVPWEPAPQPGLAGRRVLITAGRRDPIAPAAETERLAAWVRAQGAELRLLWHEGGHELRAEELAAARDALAASAAPISPPRAASPRS